MNNPSTVKKNTFDCGARLFFLYNNLHGLHIDFISLSLGFPFLKICYSGINKTVDNALGTW